MQGSSPYAGALTCSDCRAPREITEHRRDLIPKSFQEPFIWSNGGTLQNDSSPQHHPRRPRGKPHPCVASHVATTQRYRREDVLRFNLWRETQSFENRHGIPRRPSLSIFALCPCHLGPHSPPPKQYVGRSGRRPI